MLKIFGLVIMPAKRFAKITEEIERLKKIELEHIRWTDRSPDGRFKQ